MKESDWLNAGYIPKCDEYMKNAVITATCMLYVTNSLVGMDELYMTKENIEWLTNGLLVARSAAAICRCMDDISDHEVSITQHLYKFFFSIIVLKMLKCICIVTHRLINKEDMLLQLLIVT